MAQRTHKSCCQVEMGFVFVVGWLLLRQRSQYLVLYMRGSVVTAQNVCYELVRRESLHILEMEWTHAKRWTVFPPRSWQGRVYGATMVFCCYAIITVGLCLFSPGSISFFFLSFLNLLHKQLCLWFKCTTLRDSKKVLITKICQNSPTSPGNTLLPPAREKRNKKKTLRWWSGTTVAKRVQAPTRKHLSTAGPREVTVSFFFFFF